MSNINSKILTCSSCNETINDINNYNHCNNCNSILCNNCYKKNKINLNNWLIIDNKCFKCKKKGCKNCLNACYFCHTYYGIYNNIKYEYLNPKCIYCYIYKKICNKHNESFCHICSKNKNCVQCFINQNIKNVSLF